MALSNFERMIQMAEEVFAVKSNPDQLDVNEEILTRLRAIHPATVTEYNDSKGPVAWVLTLPTTLDLMNKFIDRNITEKQLLDLTPVNIKYETLYLCSAMTLPEYRKKGLTKRLTLEAIEKIRETHPIQNLFVWPFTKEGEALANAIAHPVSLPLLKRKDK
ncbi:MAG: hypothetical protein Q8L90_19440 [Bacteroidota bacterium]|nr:hypothetical protein [Bacteroidota bacterium]